MLSGTYKLSWVNDKAFQGHGMLFECIRLIILCSLDICSLFMYRPRWVWKLLAATRQSFLYGSPTPSIAPTHFRQAS